MRKPATHLPSKWRHEPVLPTSLPASWIAWTNCHQMYHQKMNLTLQLRLSCHAFASSYSSLGKIHQMQFWKAMSSSLPLQFFASVLLAVCFLFVFLSEFLDLLRSGVVCIEFFNSPETSIWQSTLRTKMANHFVVTASIHSCCMAWHEIKRTANRLP